MIAIPFDRFLGGISSSFPNYMQTAVVLVPKLPGVRQIQPFLYICSESKFWVGVKITKCNVLASCVSCKVSKYVVTKSVIRKHTYFMVGRVKRFLTNV